MTALRIPLGARVKVTHIWELPPLDSVDDEERIEMQVVPNQHADNVGVVVGKTQRFTSWTVHDGDERLFKMDPRNRRWFYAIKYSLRGKTCLADANNIEVVRI